MRVDPEARLHQHLDYFGTTVIEFGVSRPHEHLGDRRARARAHGRAGAARASRLGRRSRTRGYHAAAGEFLLPDGDRAGRRRDRRARRADARGHAAGRRCAALVEVIPDRFEYRAGVTYVGSTVERPARRRRRRLPGLRAPRAAAAAPPRDRARATCPATCGRRRTATRTRLGRGRDHAWVEALLPGADGASRVGRRRPDQPRARRRDAREDRPRPPLRRRAADQGRLPRRAGVEAERSVRMTRAVAA